MSQNAPHWQKRLYDIHEVRTDAAGASRWAYVGRMTLAQWEDAATMNVPMGTSVLLQVTPVGVT